MLIPKAAAAHRKEALHPEGRVLSWDVELPASLGFQSESLDTLFDERKCKGGDEFPGHPGWVLKQRQILFLVLVSAPEERGGCKFIF